MRICTSQDCVCVQNANGILCENELGSHRAPIQTPGAIGTTIFRDEILNNLAPIILRQFKSPCLCAMQTPFQQIITGNEQNIIDDTIRTYSRIQIINPIKFLTVFFGPISIKIDIYHVFSSS